MERGDSLPEHGRRRAFPRLPLIDDGLPRRAHQRGQLRLAQAARATKRANLLSVVAWNAGPGQWRATIIWADHPPIVRPPKRPGRGGSRAGSEVAKGGPGVIGHRQPAVPRRRSQRLDVHADQQREHGKWKEFVVVAYGVRDYLDFTDADKERQLEEALMASNPATDLTLGLEVHYFRLNSAEYFVSVFITIPGSELEPGGRGRAHVMLDLIGEVRTVYGATIQNLRDKVDIQLTDEKADRLPTRPIHYETGFTLLPDEYAIKVLARDATTGRIGTYETRFTVPNLKSEDQLVPLSSVVLSHSQVALGDEWHRVDQDPGTDEVHPLVHDNRKLIPSVTRVFGQKNDLRVLLEAYQLASQTTDGPLVAYVGLYREDTKVLETPPLLATNGRTHRPWAVPLRFRVPLQAVPPGRYRCQVTVLDPQGQKVVFWHAPVVVTP